MLSDVATLLRRLAYREDLTSEQSRELLSTICANDAVRDLDHSDGAYLVALTFGVMAKGPTANEVLGFVQSVADQSISLECGAPSSCMIDVSGTGGDKIKTFNVGSAVSVVLAAGGLFVPKQATHAYTGLLGSADVFAEVGVDVFGLTAEKVVGCLESTGLTAFHTPSLSSGPRNRLDFLRKLRNIGLTYPTLWHLVSWIYSPFKMDTRLYGVFDPRHVSPVAQAFLRLGYKRVMVVHGVDGLDEISNIGETLIAEICDGTLKHWTLTPESCGIRRSRVDEIHLSLRIGDVADSHCVRRKALRSFFEVLYGSERGAKRDLVLLNAGAGFYLCGKVDSIRDGVKMAASIIDSGRAARKLREFATFAGSPGLLVGWENEIMRPIG